MAGSRTYRTKVLVLDKTKFKETDLILTMLDERGRQVRAVAKGARKPGGRLAARCELFCTCLLYTSGTHVLGEPTRTLGQKVRNGLYKGCLLYTSRCV